MSLDLFLENQSAASIRRQEPDLYDAWIGVIARASRLSAREVKRRIEEAHGKTKVATLFPDVDWWLENYVILPELEKTTAAAARALEEDDFRHISRALRIPHSRVMQTLANATGNRLLENIFPEEFRTAYHRSMDEDCLLLARAPLVTAAEQSRHAKSQKGTRLLTGAYEAEQSRHAESQKGTRLLTGVYEADNSRPPPNQGLVAPIPQTGVQLQGGWVLGQQLGSGGFATVWEASPKNDASSVHVVKLPRGDSSEEVNQSLLRLKEEANHLAHVRHIQGVVRCSGFSEDKRFGGYIVLDHAGTSLSKKFNRRPLTAQSSCAIIERCAHILDQLHAVNKIHGDISPDNWCIDEKDRITLIDLGTAMNSTHSSRHVSGTRVGTSLAHGYHLVYSAPEVSGRPGTPTARSDQYSLALVFKALLTGIYGHLTPHMSDVAPRFHRAIEKATSERPSQRFGTCLEFVAALRC